MGFSPPDIGESWSVADFSPRYINPAPIVNLSEILHFHSAQFTWVFIPALSGKGRENLKNVRIIRAVNPQSLFADPDVFLNADPDPVAFLLRTQIHRSAHIIWQDALIRAPNTVTV